MPLPDLKHSLDQKLSVWFADNKMTRTAPPPLCMLHGVGRMKRGLLYACCREHGYNKLVLAQHLDDLAESFIMSALHNGQARGSRRQLFASVNYD